MSRRALALWFAFVIGLGLYSRSYVSDRGGGHCRLDGTAIIPIYRVDLLLDGVELASFCCVRCAREWPTVPAGASWHVRDEVTGRVLDARAASFVNSSIVTQPASVEP